MESARKTSPDNALTHRHGRWLAGMIGIAALTVCLLACSSIPLGIPGEWTWVRLSLNDHPEILLGFIACGLWGAGYLAFVRWADFRIGEMLPGRKAGLVAALAGWHLLLIFGVMEQGSDATTLSKVPFILYYPASSGYFTVAITEEPQPARLLAGYEARMREGDVLHIGTHPPGLFLFYQLASMILNHVPGLQGLVLALCPYSAVEAFTVVRENTASSAHPLTEHQEAVLWLAALVVILALVSVGPLLFRLMERFAGTQTAWRMTVFWPLVPATMIFIPKSDAAFAGLTAAALCLLGRAIAGSRGWLVALGAVLFLGLLLSLAFLPLLLACVLCLLAAGKQNVSELENSPWQGRSPATRGCNVLVLLTTIAGLVGTFDVLTGVNLPTIWSLNLQNHAGFYRQSPRTTWLWMLETPVEAMFAIGAPFLVWGLAQWSSEIREHVALRQRLFQGWQLLLRSGLSPATAIVLSLSLTWLALWLSGKNSGEAARLWLPMDVWAFAIVGLGFVGPTRSAATGRRVWLIAVGTQIICFAVTAFLVSGFDFGGSLH